MNHDDLTEVNTYAFEEAVQKGSPDSIRRYIPTNRNNRPTYLEELSRGSFGEEWACGPHGRIQETGSLLTEEDIAYLLG